MSQKVGGVLIDIQTNVAKIQKDFGNINNTIKRFSYQTRKQLKSIGLNLAAAFSVYQIKRFVTEGVKAIDTMQDMAQSSGISTRKMQGWVQAASYAGVEATGVAKAVKRLNTNILDAHYGLGEAKRLFHDLGIEYDTSSGKMRDAGPVLDEIADKFAQMEHGSREAGLANKLLGRSGSNMIPVLNLTSKGIEKVTQKLERMGALVTDDTMKTMDKVNANLKDLGAYISGIKLQVLAGLAEELRTLTDVAVDEAKSGEVFKEIGEELGHLAIKAAKAATGLLWLKKTAGALISDVADRKFGIFFDKEGNRKILDEMWKYTEDYNKILENLSKPASAIDDPAKKGQGTEGINKLLEDNRQLLSKALKEHKGIAGILADEHNQLLRIYTILSRQVSLSKEHEEVLRAIGKRMEKIRAEHERLLTSNVWGNMKYGFTDYADSVIDRNKQIQEAVVNGMKTMEDALVEGLKKGKMEWASFADAVISDITRIIVRQQITGPFAEWMGGTVGGSTPAKAPVGAGGNVIPSPITTTPTARGRRSARGRVADTTVNLSNDMQNIVAENTYLMNRDVDEFVKNSETQFRRMGRTLNRSLNADEFGRGGVLGSPTGHSYPGTGGVTGGPAISGTAASAGGIDTSDLAEKILGDAYDKVNDFLNDSGIGNPLKDAVKLANDQTLGPTHEFIEDPTLGNFGDMVVAPVVAPIQKAGEAIEDAWKSVFGRRRGGDSGGGGNTIINVPVSIEGGNSAMASEMRTEIEKTVIEVMRRYA